MSTQPSDMASAESAEQGDFESALFKLEAIVAALEEDSLDLQQALKQYEEGLRLANFCVAQLRDAELRVSELSIPENED